MLPIAPQNPQAATSVNASKRPTGPADPHRTRKQAALDQFSGLLKTSTKMSSLAEGQDVLRQAIYGDRNKNVMSNEQQRDEQIRGLIDPRETLASSLTARTCPESAALAIIACVYKAFGDQILTGGEIDQDKLKLGLYMMFGKEMLKIESDVLHILKKNFSIDADKGTLSSDHYHIEVGPVLKEDYDQVVNAKCTDPTYFYDKPKQMLVEFFGGAAQIPGVLKQASDLTSQRYKLPTASEAADVLMDRSEKMTRGAPIHHSQISTKTATGTVIKVTADATYFVDSAPSIINKLVKKTDEITDKYVKSTQSRTKLSSEITDNLILVNDLPEDQVDDLQVLSLLGQLDLEEELWLEKLSTAELVKVHQTLSRFISSMNPESSSAEVTEVTDNDEAEVDVALAIPDPAAPEVTEIFAKPVNCWCETTTMQFGSAPAQPSTVVYVGTQAFKSAEQNKANARTILDEIASRKGAPRKELAVPKTKTIVMDLRLLSPGAGEGKLWAKHTEAMRQASQDFNDSLTGQSIDYVPIHLRAEGAWAARATRGRELANVALDQLNISEDIQLAPKLENDFMTGEQQTTALDHIYTLFNSMSKASQAEYGAVLDTWVELFKARDVQGNISLFATLTNILQDAVNNDPISPYRAELIVGCKSGVDRSTSAPAAMKPLKLLILNALKNARNSMGERIRPDLHRFFDPVTGELPLENLTPDEVMMVIDHFDPNLMVKLSELNTGKASNINPEILRSTLRQFEPIVGAATRTKTGPRPS